MTGPPPKNGTRDYLITKIGGALICYDRVAKEDSNPNQAIAPEETSVPDFIERIEKGEEIRHFGAPLLFTNRDSIWSIPC